MMTNKATQGRLPSTGPREETEPWYQQGARVPIHLLGGCRWIWDTLEFFLKLISVICLWLKIRCLTHDLQPRLEEFKNLRNYL